MIAGKIQIPSVNSGAVTQSPSLQQSKPVAKSEFAEKFEKVIGRDQFKQLKDLQNVLESGKSIPARELLVYQVRLSALNQRVELLAKLGESAMATVRKFQQQQ